MLGLFKNFYVMLICVGNSLQSFLLLAMRMYWGGSLASTGFGKLLDISPISEYFSSLGIPFPTINAYLVGSIEGVCGCCLFIGLASRLASIPIICVLMGAYLTEHRQALLHAWSDPQNFIFQLPFNYLLTALIVFAFGPGKLSIDFLIQKFFVKKTY